MQTDGEKNTKNLQEVVTDKDKGEAIKNDYGMYVEDLEYNSDETRILTEDENEIFNYETFTKSWKGDDDDDDEESVGNTVEGG